MQSVIMVYGNCQAEFISDIFAAAPTMAQDYRFVYFPSYGDEGSLARTPTDEDFANCALLCEQVDWKDFPQSDRLPPDCITIRFPPLDSVLLWPFNCVNPYNEPDPPRFPYGRFVTGDRVILHDIDSGCTAEETLSHYLTGWPSYKINIKRIEEIEWTRLRRRDAKANVPAADIVMGHIATEQLFSNAAHPKKNVLGLLGERLRDACSAHVPAFATINVLDLIECHPEIGSTLNSLEVPVHPEIAKALSLSWYDPDATYSREHGDRYSYTEYFDELIRYSIAIKLKADRGDMTAAIYGADWQAPLRGVATADQTTGYFPDGWVGASLRFRATATEPMSTLSMAGLCTTHHTGPISIACLVNDIKTSSVVASPGTRFAIKCCVNLQSGASSTIEFRASEVFNLLDRGESEDNRDLGFMVEGLEAHRAP